jgi:hypothetical protein
MATTPVDTYTILSNGRPVIPKDPNAILDYTFDWTPYLTDLGDTIASVAWVLDASLAKVNETHDTMHAVVWVSGGTVPVAPPNQVPVTCRITTAGGRTDDRTIYLKIADR